MIRRKKWVFTAVFLIGFVILIGYACFWLFAEAREAALASCVLSIDARATRILNDDKELRDTLAIHYDWTVLDENKSREIFARLKDDLDCGSFPQIRKGKTDAGDDLRFESRVVNGRFEVRIANITCQYCRGN